MQALYQAFYTLLPLAARNPEWTLEILRQLWPHAVGSGIAAHTRVSHLTGRSLVITVDSPAWKKQLFPMSEEIKSKLRRTLHHLPFHDIEFRVARPGTSSACRTQGEHPASLPFPNVPPHKKTFSSK